MQFRVLPPEGRAARRSRGTAVVSAPGSPLSLEGSGLHRESFAVLPRVIGEPLWSLDVPVTGHIVIDVFCEGKKDLKRGDPEETRSGLLSALSASSNSQILCVYVCVSVCAQSCPTLCNRVDCRSPGSSLHGTFQARILEWVTISYSAIKE